MKDQIHRCLRKSAWLAAPLLWLAASPAQSAVKVAGQMLIDLNYTRGITTADVDGTQRVTRWNNFGTLGGAFVRSSDSPYAATLSGYGPPNYTLNKGGDGINVPDAPGARTLVSTIATPPDLQGNKPWTIEAWLWKNVAITGQNGIFSWTENAPPSGDAAKFCAGDPAGFHGNGKDTYWNGIPVEGRWNHLALTYDGTTEKVYVNGVLQNSVPRALNINNGTYYPMLFSGIFSAAPPQTSFSLNGAIAAVRVHSDALSEADVASNHTAGISAVPVIDVSVQPLAASSVTATSASLNGNLVATTSPSTTTLKFFYGFTDAGQNTTGWAGSATLNPPNNTGTFSAPVTGLTPNSTYVFRILASNANGQSWSAPATFSTPGAPIIANLPASLGDPGNATVSANLNPNGYATTVKLYWGTTDGGTNPVNWTHTVDLGTQAAGKVSSTLTGLNPASVAYFYTFAATNTAGTTWATPSRSFKTRNIPRTTDLLFSALTESLPDSGSTGTWGTTVPAGQSLVPIGTPSVKNFGGAKWAKTLSPPDQGFRLQTADAPNGTFNTAIPINGATIVVAAKPLPRVASNNWESIVDIFYDRLVLGIRNDTGQVNVRRNGSLDFSSATIPVGQTTILSLVVQPTGEYKVWANGTEIMNVTNTSDMSTLNPLWNNGGTGFWSYMNVGRNNPDGWTAYNGHIGDVFVYKTALSDADRLALEADLTTKFITDANITFDIVASAGPNGSISPTGTTSVLQGENITYNFTGNSGYVVEDVLIDGVSAGPLLSYTFEEVSASHTIAATFVALPPQNITATAGANGTISPSGSVSVAAGANQTFTIAPNNGYKIANVIVDGISVGQPATYTFNFVTAPHTINVTFEALSLNIPKSGNLLFSVISDSLPAGDGAAITSWPTYVPTSSLGVIGTPTVEIQNTRKWSKHVYAEGDGYRFGGSYANPIPCSGATIVAVVQPSRAADSWWSSIVNVFYNKLMLNVRNTDGMVQVVRNGQWYDGVVIPADSPAVLAAVVQPTGETKLFINGTEVFSKTDTTDFTQIVPGTQPYEKFVNVGRNDPDGWTTYNGNIGDVFVYTTALSDADRQLLEGVLMPRWGIEFRTITATAGPNGKISPAGEVKVVTGTNPTFTFTPDYGFAVGDVLVDGESVGPVPYFIFDNVSANHTISVTFVGADAYGDWISYFFFEDDPEAAKNADPDNDGQTNIVEFALDGDPTSPASTGKTRVRIEDDGGPALMLTLPVVDGAVFSGETSKSATIGSVTYTIEGTNDLTNFNQVVTEVVPARSEGMENLGLGWTYRTFRLNGNVPARGSKGYLRVKITPTS